MLSDQAEKFRKVVAHKGGFSRKGLRAVLENTDRFSEVTVEVGRFLSLSIAHRLIACADITLYEDV